MAFSSDQEQKGDGEGCKGVRAAANHREVGFAELGVQLDGKGDLREDGALDVSQVLRLRLSRLPKERNYDQRTL